MKVLFCEECHDHLFLVMKHTRTCMCGKTAGKYIGDGITAIVTDGIVYGIDHGVGLRDSMLYAKTWNEDHPDVRRDFYFTGWVPSKPGEIIRVDSVEDVESFDYDYKVSDFNKWGTKPVTD